MKKLFMIMIAFALTFAVGCKKKEEARHDEHGHGEKREEEEHKEGAPELVTLTEESLATSRIATEEVLLGSAIATTRVFGRCEFNKDVTAEVHAPMEGRLQEWLVNIGDKVRKGDTLARVESPQNLGNPILLRAPLDGEVVERAAVVGTWVKPEDKLLVLTDPAAMWVVAEAREDLVGRVLTDLPAKIRCLSHPDETFEGKFLRTAPQVEAETRTVEFLFAVSNSDRKLRAGMFSYVSLPTERIADKLLVHDDAVQSVKGRSMVFVEQERGKYLPVEVRLGRKVGEQVEVLDGLKGGEKVVTTGSFVLKSEFLRAELGEGHAH